MPNIKKRPYPWPGTTALRYSDLDKMAGSANRSLGTDPSMTIQQAGNSIGLRAGTRQPVFFGRMITQDEIDDNEELSGETAGLLVRKTHVIPSGDEVDDDMMSAWCYLTFVSNTSNTRVRDKDNPVLVYFPQIPVPDEGDAPGEGCELISFTEHFPVSWHDQDERWMAIRPQFEGDIMDIVMVCDEDEPVEKCWDAGNGDNAFCCLFDGAAFRVHPDCTGEAGGGYYCNPDSSTFDVWLYSPDKRSLPPEGTCDWGKRIQDAYTINWKPFGEYGPSVEETRPVYQVAACTCDCPNDSLTKIEFWCLGTGESKGYATSVSLRPAEPRGGPDPDIVAYEGEFSVTYPQYPSIGMIWAMNDETLSESEDDQLVRMFFHNALTGEIERAYRLADDQTPRLDQPASIPNDDQWGGISQNPLCHTIEVDEEGQEIGPFDPSAQTFWYRIHLECMPAEGDWEGIPPVVYNIDLTLLVPPENFMNNFRVLNTETGKYEINDALPADCCDEPVVVQDSIELIEISDHLPLTSINPCMGRVNGIALQSRFNASSVINCYGDTSGCGTKDNINLKTHYLGGCVNPAYMCPLPGGPDPDACGEIAGTDEDVWQPETAYPVWSVVQYAPPGQGSTVWIALTNVPACYYDPLDPLECQEIKPGQTDDQGNPYWVKLTHCAIYWKINYECAPAKPVGGTPALPVYDSIANTSPGIAQSFDVEQSWNGNSPSNTPSSSPSASPSSSVSSSPSHSPSTSISSSPSSSPSASASSTPSSSPSTSVSSSPSSSVSGSPSPSSSPSSSISSSPSSSPSTSASSSPSASASASISSSPSASASSSPSASASASISSSPSTSASSSPSASASASISSSPSSSASSSPSASASASISSSPSTSPSSSPSSSVSSSPSASEPGTSPSSSPSSSPSASISSSPSTSASSSPSTSASASISSSPSTSASASPSSSVSSSPSSSPSTSASSSPSASPSSSISSSPSASPSSSPSASTSASPSSSPSASASSTPSSSPSSSPSSTPSASPSSSESMLPIFCGCGGPYPQYMYVDLQGIQDGAYCGICDLLNKTYYLGPVGGTADYCIWYNDYGAGIHYSLQVEIGHAGGGRYEINVWLYVSDLYCPDYKDNNLYWHHEQYAPYDCDNLDLLIPFQWDEGGEGGCTGGTCRIRTYPESS